MNARGAPRDARRIAFDLLRRVEGEGAFASILLQQLGADVPAREAGLATEIVYGCLRHKLRDEHVLAEIAGRPLASIDPDVAILFRIAAHQVLRLDRVPDSAAVNEAVATVRALPGRAAGGAARREAQARFLNAVLRRLCACAGALPLPLLREGAGPEEQAATLAVLESHPPWIVRRWLARFGLEETVELLRAHNRAAPVTVRVDAARATVEQAAASMILDGCRTGPSPVHPSFLRVLDGAPQRTAAFRAGWIYIQDEASGLVPDLLDVRPGARVLDACAAPGGKTLALARRAGSAGLVVAGDRHPARLRLVAANAARMRVGRIALVAGDFSAPPVRGTFDAVLVDAPCSGTGLFRRDAESRYRLEPADLDRLSAAQREILEGVAPLVRAGGSLVYSVCSLEPEEGTVLVDSFLASHPEFRRAGPGAAPGHAAPFLDGRGDLATLPHRHGTDGFQAALLRRLA